MLVEFFDPPDPKLLRQAYISCDSIRLMSLLQALPPSILLLVTKASQTFPEGPNDYKGEEQHRNALNNAISMADLMLEIVDALGRYETILPRLELKLIITNEVCFSLERLQCEKDRVIKRTHDLMSEYFGSRTGFQMTKMTNYHTIVGDLKNKWDKE